MVGVPACPKLSEASHLSKDISWKKMRFLIIFFLCAVFNTSLMLGFPTWLNPSEIHTLKHFMNFRRSPSLSDIHTLNYFLVFRRWPSLSEIHTLKYFLDFWGWPTLSKIHTLTHFLGFRVGQLWQKSTL